MLLELSCSWLLTHSDIWCFWLHLKQKRLGKPAARWPYLRQLKRSFFELTFYLCSTESLTSAQSFSLCPIQSQNTHFQFAAFWWRVLKYLSLRIGGFSLPVSVTGFLLAHCLNASRSLGKSHCCHSPPRLTTFTYCFQYLHMGRILIGLLPWTIAKAMIPWKCAFITLITVP